jgi:hypothetical protein
LRNVKAQYDDLQANSRKDLSEISEPYLLSDATLISLGKTSSGEPALVTGAGIADGAAVLNSYFNRDWKQETLRNALIGAGNTLITGDFSYHIITFFLLKPESIAKITLGNANEMVRHFLKHQSEADWQSAKEYLQKCWEFLFKFF